MHAEINGTRLYYSVIGSGAPVYMLHGGLGYDHTPFRPWLDPWADKFKVVFYDHRGNGRSEELASMDDVTHDTLVDDLEALRCFLGDETFTLAGNSYGGVLGQEYALKYPDRLKGLVLITTLPVFDYPDVVSDIVHARGTPEQIDVWTNEFPYPVNSDEHLTRIAKTLMSLYFSDDFDKQKIDEISEAVICRAVAWNRGFEDLLPNWSTLDRLKDLFTDTLVIGGAHDWITPVEQGAKRLHENLPNSELIIYENSGHFPFIEEQSKFLKEVGEWISKR